MHVKNGDKVQVMAGRERGRTGTVKRIDKKRGRVTVDGLNIVKRHQRAGAQNAEGGIIEKEAFIDASNVMLFSEKLERGVRTTIRYVGDAGEHFEKPGRCALEFFDQAINGSEGPRVLEDG